MSVVPATQERTRINRRHIHAALLQWKGIALGGSGEGALAAMPATPSEPETPKPRWLKSRKASSTRVAHVPEALLERKGGGSTLLYRVKWIGM